MPATDEAIIQAIRSDPEQGFRMLVGTYGKALYWHIRRLVVAHDDAEDAAQETLIRAFRSFGTYRADSSLSTWLYRIATREALRVIERRPAEKAILEEAAGSPGEPVAESYVDYSDLEAVRLQQAILSLPAKQQLAFNLRYYDEMGYEAIAEVIGSTAAAAKANYHVAKEKIIQYINTHDA